MPIMHKADGAVNTFLGLKIKKIAGTNYANNYP
jgi:hypothetical protein